MYPIMDEYYNPSGRSPEQSNVAVMAGEGRDDGARDLHRREVVFVEDRRIFPTAPPGSDSPQLSNASTVSFDASSPLPTSSLKADLSSTKDSSAQTTVNSSPMMVA
jgi:hypothetical protein